MRYLPRGKPSASMVVSLIALVVALSGTAMAASNLVSGDKLIKKRSLSGNRLRNHTITGTPVNMRSLGKVRSAANADHATTASTAGVAGNASMLGGQPPSAFDSANLVRTGLVSAAAGQTVTMARFGPFTMTLTCRDHGGGSSSSEVAASSTEANSDIDNDPASSGGVTQGGPSSGFADSDASPSDFITASGQAWLGLVTAAVHFPGVANPCVATALIGRS